MALTIGTYNVAKPSQRDLEDWSIRKNLVLDNLKRSNLDIVCLQELSGQNDDQRFLTEEVRKLGYAYLFESKKEATGLAIIYKKDKFEQLGENRGEYSSVEEGRTCTRSFKQVDLQDKTTRKTVRVACMHLYGGASRGNTLGQRQLQSFRKQIETSAENISELVLAGDFNSDLDEELNGSHTICRSLLEPAASPYRYRTVTVDDAGNKIVTSKSRHQRHLDWIFVGKKGAEGTSVSKIRPLKVDQNTKASDHLMHAVEVLQEQEPYQAWKPTQAQAARAEHSKEDRAWLENYFCTKTKLQRDTVISSFNIDKDAAYKRLEEWIKAGYIKKEGHGRETYYTKGVNLAEVPQPAGKFNPLDLELVKQGLAKLFQNKTSITREDLLTVFSMERSEANGYTRGWISQGLLIQHGQGRSTYYTKPATNTPKPRTPVSPSLIEKILNAIAEFFRALTYALRRKPYRIKG